MDTPPVILETKKQIRLLPPLVSDKVFATQLLKQREVESLRLRSYFRARYKVYLGILVLFVLWLAMFISAGLWSGFGLGIAFILGFFYSEYIHFRAHREYFPFSRRVINWDLVKKISEDEPSA
jgi:hypothetical protein